MDRALEYGGAANRFTGYEHLSGTAKIVALYADGTSVAALKAGQSGVVVLDSTPFYAESGGQVGDQGLITAGSARFAVQDTQKIKADVYGHHGVLGEGTLNVGDTVQAQVDGAERAATMRNHSVTHLMHKALREVLGAHVQQKGSLVNAERTRFDFAHNAPVTAGQIREIECRVNAEILANTATDARVMDIESAQKTGAVMLFGEKYGETVRVLDIGTSRELCGGTHVQRTGDIGPVQGRGRGRRGCGRAPHRGRDGRERAGLPAGPGSHRGPGRRRAEGAGRRAGHAHSRRARPDQGAGEGACPAQG
ncbi:alanyl-tRNA synthetase protein [Alicycliphilus sp. B1]|nr:alanyl-tRNA synthetase protein [Alicycliphilus sp. B1]